MGDYYARVEPQAPEAPKFEKLADLLEINTMWAFGMSTAIWCLCWKNRWTNGRLSDLSARALAKRLSWTGDPEKLVKAMMDARVLDQDEDGTFIAHGFEERQKGGIGIYLRNKARPKRGETTAAAAPSQGAAGDDTVVRVLMQRMRECHVTGGAQQKREHAEAWKARGLADKAEQLIMGEGKGLDIFSIAKMLNGSAPKKVEDSMEKIRKKFLGEDAAK